MIQALRVSKRPILAVIAALLLVACDLPALKDRGNSGPTVDVSQPVTLALLVPTESGDGARDALGQSLINAANMAAGGLVGAEVVLKIYPTGGDAARAAAAADVALAEGASLIIGPLFSDAAAAAAARVAPAGIKVLSFSNTTYIAGGNLYLLGIGYPTISDRLVGYLNGRGLTRIASVVPEGIEGGLAVEAIDTAANRFGAQMVARASYPLSIEGIQSSGARIAQTIKGSGANAVVFSDGPTGGLALIAEALRGRGVQANNTRFAGLQRWNISAQAVRQPSLDGGFFAAPDPALGNAFADRYRTTFGTDPHPLAGLAFDGVAAAGALIAEARSSGARDPFSAARLTQADGFAGVNGVFRFRSDGQSERALAIYEIKDGQAVVADPAPLRFGNGGT